METRIHFNQLCYVGKSTDGALKLALDELPKDVQCFNFQFFRERKILGGSIYKIVSSPDDVGFARLEDSEMGRLRKAGKLCCDRNPLAMKYGEAGKLQGLSL